MQRTIRNRLYDTTTATLIQHFVSGCYGDPSGYEEMLYRTPDGYYFLYGIGGKTSPYAVESLRSVSVATAEKWQETHPETF